MPELLNKDQLRTALENAIKGKAATRAPFSVAWANGTLTRAHLARWAENHYHYVGPFADYLAYIYARTPDKYTEAKDFLLSNMYEEEIGGDRHTDLLIRFAEACGTTRERVIDPDNMSATTRGLQSWCYAVAMREDPIVAVAGLVVGLESQVPSIYRKQTPTLREKYHFTDEEVEFFDLHIVSDEIHGERGYQIVLEHATTRRTAAALPEDLRSRRPDAAAVHHRALLRLRRTRWRARRPRRDWRRRACRARAPAGLISPGAVPAMSNQPVEEFRNHIGGEWCRGRGRQDVRRRQPRRHPRHRRPLPGLHQRRRPGGRRCGRGRLRTAGAPRRSPSAPRCCWTRPTISKPMPRPSRWS